MLEQMRDRRFLLVASILALVALSLSFAGCSMPRNAEKVGSPGSMRIGLIGAPNSLNPLFETQSVEGFLNDLSFDALLKSSPDGTLTAALAKTVPTRSNGGISLDGTTITFHLRRGVQWQDGAPFTADDVVFSQAARMNPNNAVPLREQFDEVASIVAPSAATVVVRLRRASASFLSEFTTAPVVPAHLLENAVSFNAPPIGTGLFRVSAWRRGDRVELVANVRYYAGLPRLRRLTVVLFADDNSAQVALRSGELAAIYAPSIEIVRAVRSDPRFRLVTVDENAVSMIAMNTTGSPLRDRRVREAIALAIDRRRLVQVVSGGVYTSASGPIPATHWARDRRAPLSYDPARARAQCSLVASVRCCSPFQVATQRPRRLPCSCRRCCDHSASISSYIVSSRT